MSPIEAAERRKQSTLLVVRICFLTLFGVVAFWSVLSVTSKSDPSDIERAINQWGQTLGLAAAMGVLIVLVDILTPRKRVGTIFSIFVGLLASMLAVAAIGFIIDLLAITFGFSDAKGPIATAKMLTGIGLAYLCISTVIQTQDDFRLVVPYVEFTKQLRGPRPHLLDTSALIDARIADLCATGIVQYPVVVPHFVVAELQLLGDSQDKLKRGRGRRGLDVIARLQRTPALDISIDETPIPGKAVDQMLVELAKRMEAVIITADVGLNRVAGIQGVRVLNLNDVANALKPALIPGEQLSIRLIKPGEQPTQAVGYLEDGTMVVAEDGRAHVGQQVTLTVTSTLQTSAGRLIFARMVEGDGEAAAAAPERSGSGEAEVAPAIGGAGADGQADPGGGPCSGPGGGPDGGPAVIPVSPPPSDRARSPYPPKPPSKRVNPFRNPRR